MNVLVTGANGFVGEYLTNYLEEKGHIVFRGVRKSERVTDRSYGNLENLNQKEDWDSFFKNIDAIVHCAARVHVMNETSSDPLEEFRKANVNSTRVLATKAKQYGIRKFIFLSSIKVNGEVTPRDVPYSETDEPKPQDPYGISKYEAEEVLKEISKTGEMEVIVLRPPLIYGPGVKGNIKRLVKLIKRIPIIPLGGIKNKRSMISLKNLSSIIERGINKTLDQNYSLFLVSDNSDVSTSSLIQLLAKSIDKRVYLLPIPVKLLSFTLNLLGKTNFNQRLFGSLIVDSNLVRKKLNWVPDEDLVTLFKEVTD